MSGSSGSGSDQAVAIASALTAMGGRGSASAIADHLGSPVARIEELCESAWAAGYLLRKPAEYIIPMQPPTTPERRVGSKSKREEEGKEGEEEAPRAPRKPTARTPRVGTGAGANTSASASANTSADKAVRRHQVFDDDEDDEDDSDYTSGDASESDSGSDDDDDSGSDEDDDDDDRKIVFVATDHCADALSAFKNENIVKAGVAELGEAAAEVELPRATGDVVLMWEFFSRLATGELRGKHVVVASRSRPTRTMAEVLPLLDIHPKLMPASLDLFPERV